MQNKIERHISQVKQFEFKQNQFYVSTIEMAVEPHDGNIMMYDQKANKSQKILDLEYGIGDFDIAQIDGKTMAIIATDENCILYTELKDQIEQIEINKPLNNHYDLISQVKINPNQKKEFISAGFDGQISFWRDFELVRDYKTKAQINSVTFDSNDHHIFYSVGFDKICKVWDSRQSHEVNAFASFSSVPVKIQNFKDNLLLVGQQNGQLSALNPSNLNIELKNSNQYGVVDFDYLGNEIVVSRDNYSVQILDSQTFQQISVQNFEDLIVKCTFDHFNQNNMLLAGIDKTLRYQQIQ